MAKYPVCQRLAPQCAMTKCSLVKIVSTIQPYGYVCLGTKGVSKPWIVEKRLLRHEPLTANPPFKRLTKMRSAIMRCSRKVAHCNTRSNDSPFTVPPPIAARTLRLKPSRLCLRSSAASLFSGSDALGSRKRNCIPLATRHESQRAEVVLNAPGDQQR